jgi:general secretion pathway protein G
MRLHFAVRGRRISGRRPESESQIFGRRCNAGERNQPEACAHQMRSAIPNNPAQTGFTLLEIIIVLTILSVLTAAAIPMVRNTVIRERESELRLALRQLRQAIDRYKKLHDDTNGAAIPIEFKTQSGYPKDLKVLEEGFIPANVVGTSSNKIRFIRRIPIDPMLGRAEWGQRGYKDEPDATSWGGDDVWDVRSKSDGVALNGTKYRDW